MKYIRMVRLVLVKICKYGETMLVLVKSLRIVNYKLSMSQQCETNRQEEVQDVFREHGTETGI